MEHNLGPIEGIPAGEGRNFQIGATIVAVFRTRAGDVFATQPNCPHKGGPLADGMLGGSILMCPLHDRSWDVRTGAPTGADCKLATYPARLDDERRVILTLP